MRTIVTVLIALCALTLPARTAAAQTEGGINEVKVSGSFDRSNQEFGARATTIEVSGRYGYFLTDRLEAGPAVEFLKIGFEDSAWAASGFVAIHVGNTGSRAMPYIEASYGQFFGNTFGDEPTFTTVGPGFKWFFGEGGGALDMNVSYRHQFLDYNGAPNFATGIREIVARVGVSVFFGR